MSDSIMDVFNAAAGFTGTVLNQVDKWNEEKAQIELTAMQNQFNTDLNNELMKIQSSNNWEDWQGQINKFMDKTNAKLAVKSDNNPYYCRNAYTAQKAKEMLDAQRVQVKAKVDQMVWNKETEHYTELYQKNRDSDRTNLLLTPQQRYENGRNEAKMLLENGRISESAYNKEMDRLYQQTYSDAYISQVSGFFDAGINNGWSFERIIQEASKDPVTMKKLGLDGMEESVDLSQLQASLKKNLKEDYAARIKDMQDQNENLLSAIYREVTAAETEQGKLEAKRKGQAFLKTLEGGFKLDADRYNEYAYKFNIEPKKVTSTGVSTSGGNNGNGNGTGNQQKESWSVTENLGITGAVNMMLNGEMDYESSVEWVQDYWRDRVDDNKVKEIQNATPEQRDLFIAERGYPALDKLSSTLLNEVFKDPMYAEAKKKMENLMTDMNKNPDKYGSTTYTWVLMNVVDLASNGGLRNKDPRDINTMIDKWTSASYAEKLDKMAKYKTDEYGMATLKNNKERNNYFTTVLDVGENNDVVYGDQKGVHWRSEEDQKEYDKAVKTMTYDFAKAMGGVDPSKVKVSYKKDSTGDEVPIPVFTVGGESYYPRAIRDGKGNAVGYEYVNQKNGVIVKPHDWENPTDAQKKVIKQQREEAKAAEKAAKGKLANLDQQRAQERAANVEAATTPSKAMLYYDKEVGDIWNDTNLRGQAIQDTIPKIDKDIQRINNIKDNIERAKSENEYKQKTNINIAEWNKMKDEQKKIDYLLKLK